MSTLYKVDELHQQTHAHTYPSNKTFNMVCTIQHHSRKSAIVITSSVVGFLMFSSYRATNLTCNLLYRQSCNVLDNLYAVGCVNDSGRHEEGISNDCEISEEMFPIDIKPCMSRLLTYRIKKTNIYPISSYISEVNR